METITTELIETKKDERGRRICNAEERAEIIKRYEASGLTQKVFAQKEGVKYTTFVNWVQEARRAGGNRAMSFAEVQVSSLAANGYGIEVQLIDGTLIRGSTAEAVSALVRLLRC